MAIIQTYAALDMRAVDFSTPVATATATAAVTPPATLLPAFSSSVSYLGLTPVSYSYAGATIDSAFGVNWSGGSMLDAYMGAGITVDGTGTTPTGGTVLAIAQYDVIASAALWYAADFSLAMTDIWAVISTAGTSDDASFLATTLGGDDLMLGSTGGDRMLGFAGSDGMSLNAGNDRAWGGTGRDAIDGGEGNDRLFGQQGNDFLQGGLGDDLINGGSGKDWVVFDNRFDVSPARVTVDLRISGPQATGYGNDTISGIEHIAGGVKGDRLSGDGGSNRIYGGNGGDRIHGRGGNDLLKGNDGKDFLWGDNGNDRLFGGANGDVLGGGAGNDRMTGGAGSDTFVFDAGDGSDTVTDLVAGEHLKLDGALDGGGLATAGSIAGYYAVSGSDVVLDFGGGDVLTLLGAASLGVAGIDAMVTIA